MKNARYAVLAAGFLLAAWSRAADLSSPVEELHLKDGRVLHHVVFVGFGASTTIARWAEGRGTIAYEVLPDDVRAEAEKHRPAPPDVEDDSGAVASGPDAAQQEAEREHRAAEALKRKEAAEAAAAAQAEQKAEVQEQQRLEKAAAEGWIRDALEITQAAPLRSGVEVTIENHSGAPVDVDWQEIVGVSTTGDIVAPSDGSTEQSLDDWSVPAHGSKKFVIGFGPFLHDGNRLASIRWKPGS